ncbi:MAG: 4'-phosphopantetheinyl transferase family protein [Deltaproteobacteria bacterium]
MGDPAAQSGWVPSADAAEVWLARLDTLAEPLAELEMSDPICPAGEVAEFDPFRRAARQLLRRLIARTFGRSFAEVPFAAGPHGKPCVPGLPGDFNLSHTGAKEAGAFALIGIGPAASIGVDLEQSRIVRLDSRRRAKIAEAAIRAAEGAELPPDEEARILQAWVRLEAWGKAEGRGIGRTLTHFGIWGRETGALSASKEPGGAALVVFDVDAGPGLWGAVAVPRASQRPPLHTVPEDPIAACRLLAGLPEAGQIRR